MIWQLDVNLDVPNYVYKKIKKKDIAYQSTYANSPLKAHRTKAKQGGVFVSATVLGNQKKSPRRNTKIRSITKKRLLENPKKMYRNFK